MQKVPVILRTIFLAFIVVYLLGALPLALLISSDAKQGSVAVSIDVIRKVASAAWLAVGWIFLEVVVGWGRLWLAGRRAARAAGTPTPPTAPPAP